MIVYAIFLCFQASASCQAVSQPQYVYGLYTPAKVYASLGECQEELLKFYAGGWKGGHPKLDAHGRFVMEPGVWYECRHRHVDTWESQ